ncbi:hypothetical protein RUND412_006610, partial [Rhizina undulata]
MEIFGLREPSILYPHIKAIFGSAVLDVVAGGYRVNFSKTLFAENFRGPTITNRADALSILHKLFAVPGSSAD